MTVPYPAIFWGCCFFDERNKDKGRCAAGECVCVCVCARTHVHVRVHVGVCVHACMRACVCVWGCVCDGGGGGAEDPLQKMLAILHSE